MTTLPSQTAAPGAFRALFMANLSAQFSEQVALAAAPLVAVLTMQAGAAATGLLQSAQTLPFLLLSLPAGVLADRYPRARLMARAEFMRAASLGFILGLYLAGHLNLIWLAGLGFCGAVGTVVYNVAAPALVPDLVARSGLASANRWLELARSAAFAAGPAIGGVFVGWIGAAGAYSLAILLSLLAVIFQSTLPKEPPITRQQRHPLVELAEGWHFVMRHRLLKPMFLCSIIYNTGFFMIQGVFVAYGVHHLGMDATTVGLVLASFGFGMLCSGLIAPWLMARLRPGLTIMLGPTAGLGAALMVALSITFPSTLLVALAFFLLGLGAILWVIATVTVRQITAPGALLGRVSAVMVTGGFGARPLGAALAAGIAAAWGVDACLYGAALCFLAQWLVILASPVPALRSYGEAAPA